ncbi:uncharacterized protein LOC121378903 [Gigantopelta aegis]|uniref:uncharacterized protein LOC121378903 n=1 Tax=Gigantopelta aegis TaxID=1735272 RepID=UPI001B88C980|nr:uncharacterized protein LOC121378903 [Gigantopelta aegis]
MSEEKSNNDVATEQPQEENGLKYDFTDTDALIKELETVELTEEDTEDLLIEAYRMNMMLKEVLRAQEAQKKKKKKSNSDSGQPAQCPRNANRSHRRSPGSTLPPIHRAETTLVGRSQTKQTESGSRAPTRSNSKSKMAASPSRKATRSAADRPVWDDRFSFS